MSAGDLLDDAVSAKDPEQAGDLGAELLALVGIDCSREEQRKQVAVAEAVDEELAATDGFRRGRSGLAVFTSLFLEGGAGGLPPAQGSSRSERPWRNGVNP